MQLDLGGQSMDEIAIERIRDNEPPDGYWLAFSGGKDSTVVLDLAKRAGVKYEAVYTTMPAPGEHVVWMRQTYPDVRIIPPATTLWRLMRDKGFPPQPRSRYCCEHFKERYGNGNVLLTGVRWQESARRQQRSMVESCNVYGTHKSFVHPIIDWSESDVWSYIREHGLPHSPLYDEGFSRVGCVLCPLASAKQKQRDAQRWPKVAAQWVRVFDDLVARMPDCSFDDGQQMFEWYIGKRKGEKQNIKRTCLWCGAELTYTGKGRVPRYCCDAHRAKHAREQGRW